MTRRNYFGYAYFDFGPPARRLPLRAR